ncbi:MAG: transcription elongation factor GreA [Acutalibacteraceae bacterium]|jgi:transcription elongation factor GreA
MAKQVMMTEEGLKKLENELDELKSVKRREVSEKIKIALSFGDLSENSEYDEAKNEQAIVESRILELEEMLKNAQVIDASELSADTVHIGSRVVVYDSEFEEQETYQIVGSKEANPVENKISDESPVGRALLGLHAGDDVQVETPGGAVTYRVIEITQ